MFRCRGKAVSVPTKRGCACVTLHRRPRLLAITRKGILRDCSINGLILSLQKGSGLSASCLRAQSPRDLRRSVLTDPGGQLYWLLEACPREPGTKPQGLSPTRALLLPSWSSDVKLCCWGNVIGREPVENGLLVESGNGRIWKHLAVCTDGRAVPLKRLLFKVKLSTPFCSSNLCLVQMTFF